MSIGQVGVALAVLVGAILVFGAPATIAHAQSAPFTAYGVGIASGQVIVAHVGGTSCGSTTADALGNWMIPITAEAPCHPREGDIITFTLAGRATGASETWRPGGAPKDIAKGISLSAAADTRAPAVKAPASISVTVEKEATSAPATLAQIAAFLAAATASDEVDGSVTVTHNAPETFPLGSTQVTFMATDKAGNRGSATANVVVAVGGGTGTFATPLPETGIAPVVWNGGTVDEVVSAGGPATRSVWTFRAGQSIGYVIGAPPFVNVEFLGLFPNQIVPKGEILVLQLG